MAIWNTSSAGRSSARFAMYGPAKCNGVHAPFLDNLPEKSSFPLRTYALMGSSKLLLSEISKPIAENERWRLAFWGVILVNLLPTRTSGQMEVILVFFNFAKHYLNDAWTLYISAVLIVHNHSYSNSRESFSFAIFCPSRKLQPPPCFWSRTPDCISSHQHIYGSCQDFLITSWKGVLLIRSWTSCCGNLLN